MDVTGVALIVGAGKKTIPSNILVDSLTEKIWTGSGIGLSNRFKLCGEGCSSSSLCRSGS